MSVVPGLGGQTGGGFPLLTGFGPTTTPGGFSNSSFGTPGITGFGFPTPFVDPLLFFIPGASSFFLNRLLGSAAGIAVPINFGPVPSTMGLPPLVLGFPFFGDGIQGQAPFVGAGSPFGSFGNTNLMGTGVMGSGMQMFGGTGIPGGFPSFSGLGGFGGFA